MRRPLSHEAAAGILLAAGCVLFFLPRIAFEIGWKLFLIGWMAAFIVWIVSWWGALGCASLSALLSLLAISDRQGDLVRCIFALAAALTICFLTAGSAAYICLLFSEFDSMNSWVGFLFDSLFDWVVNESFVIG